MRQIKFQISNSEKGITLVEIVVVIFIIALFSLILMSDFPKMQRQFALSRVTYKLAQDFRKVEDLGLSGVQIKDSMDNSVATTGYGIYISIDPETQITKQYMIYADVKPNSATPGNKKYDGDFSTPLCSSAVNPTTDCPIEIIDVNKENPSLFIDSISNIGSTYTSINFSPPGPTVDIDNLTLDQSDIGIVLKNTDNLTRSVLVNISGLIDVQ